MTTENDETASAATAAARVLNPVNQPPSDEEAPADDDNTARFAEHAALIAGLEQEIRALSKRVQKLERMRPTPPT